MSGRTGVVQTLGTVIIIIILLLIFYQLYKKYTETPPEEPGSTPGSSGIDVSGQFGGPGAATAALPWDPTRDDHAGMYGFIASMLADMIAKQLRDMAEREERRRLEEKARAEAEKNAQRDRKFKDDFDNRLRDIENSRMKKFEEQLRKQRNELLTEKGLTDADIQSRVAAVDENWRKWVEEQLRKQRIDLLAERGLTDVDIQNRVEVAGEMQRKVVDEQLRKQRNDLLVERGLTTIETDAKISDVETTYKKTFEEKIRITASASMSTLTPAQKARLVSRQHTRTSSYEVRRMVAGEPQRGTDGRIDESKPAYSSAEGTNKISTKAMSNFSHLQLAVLEDIKSPMFKKILQALFKAKNGISNFSKPLDRLAATKGGKALASGFEAIGDFLDFAQVVMTFTDAAFYNQFPEEIDLFTSDRMDGYSNFTLKSQLDVIGTYNNRMDIQNEDTSAYGYPFAYVQFPLINGPLTQVDMNTPGFKGDVYYNQTRIETEIDAVREYLLRTLEPYKSSIRSSIDSAYGAGTSNAISVDLTQTFVSYLNYYDPNFIGLTDSQRDSLYELAYSNVCTKYDGIVYVDYYKTDPLRKGRKRFQCGFKSASVCNANTVRWYDELNKGNSIGGEYGEWYTFSELLTKTVPGGTTPILASNTFESYTLGGNVYANDQTSITNGQQGACMIMNSTLYSICYSTAKDFQTNYKVDPVVGAGYDFATHKCVFTPAYCQTLGTCYSRKNKTCELPTEDLNGVSMIFGTGGPREFIRLHGCTVEDGLGQTDPMKIMRSGLGVITEAMNRMEDWGPGLRQSLASPTGSLMFATAVMGVAMSSKKKAIFELKAAPKFIAGGVMTGAMITLMVLIAVESLAGVYEQRAAPIDDPLEYTIGGWRPRTDADPASSTGKAVRPMSFLDGWVTKPILYHPPGQMNQPYAAVNAFPVKTSASDTRGVVVTRSMFATQLSGSDLRSRLSTCLPDTQAVGRLQTVMGSGLDMLTLGLSQLNGFTNLFTGSLTCPQQYTCYKDPPSGYPQFSFTRASSRAEANQMYCIQPFPIMSADQDLHDPEIGPLAGPSTDWLTSNIWTSGEDAYTPTFPMDSVTRGPESQNRWYYQLVYDKKSINRAVIWDDAKMSKYFDGTTINYIRQGTCSDDFYATDANGNPVPVDPRCFGFLQVAFSNYKFSPMTLMATVSNAVIPP